jgi:hypothetical protein
MTNSRYAISCFRINVPVLASFLSSSLTIIMTELDKRYVLEQPSQRYPFKIVGISGSCEILKEGIIFAFHLSGG